MVMVSHLLDGIFYQAIPKTTISLFKRLGYNLDAGVEMAKDSSYQIWKLVNQRVFIDDIGFCHPVQIICDIDKTYLETKFESLAMMAKIAFESSEDKITVQGAEVLISWLRWGVPSDLTDFTVDQVVPLHFVSSSPPQLRKTLEEKLMLDGLLWSTDTFKDQAYNIFRGKFKLLKHQVPYKVAAILSLISQMKDDCHLLLIGDNAESDPMIYQSIALFLGGYISQVEFIRILGGLGVKKEYVSDILDRVGVLPRNVRSSIFIRRLESYPHTPSPIGGDLSIYYFDHYLELAVHLLCQNLIDPRDPFQLMKAFHNRSGFSLKTIGTALDSARRVYQHLEPIYAEVKAGFGNLGVDLETDAWEREVYEHRWREYWSNQRQYMESPESPLHAKYFSRLFNAAKGLQLSTNGYMDQFFQWLRNLETRYD